MELRKQKEIEYYNEKAKKQLGNLQEEKKEIDFEGFSPFVLSSYKFLQDFLKDKCKGKKVLDYGCGNGIHSVCLSEISTEVVGVDLSEPSLKIAQQRVRQAGIENKAKFILMDCEKLDFPDNSFDIIFDGGTFSSLDLKKVFPELRRVLKPGGFLIGIETLGHNPLTNLKRRFNKKSGKRTEWAASHIFQMQDFKEAKKYFNKTEAYFFHLISWITFPFLNLPGGKILLKLFEKIDHFLIFLFPFLRKYSFKIVFILQKTKRQI